MDHKFYDVDEEKQNVILNSGYSEFAKQGKKRSSLNKILQEAGISKGFFYHYFKNKEEFYDFLLEHGVDRILKKMKDESILEERDFIKRVQLTALYKTQVSKEHPLLFQFFTTYYKNATKEELIKMTERTSGEFTQRILTENIDYSLFKEDFPKEVAMKVVSKYIAGLQNELETIVMSMSYDQIAAYYQRELEDLKKVVYKGDE